MILAPFAGPRGWDVGLRQHTDEPCLGFEIDGDACATSRAAGFPVLRRDVAAVDPSRFRGAAGVIMSPPCTAFSNAGKRKGKRWLSVLVHAICTQRWHHRALRLQDPTIWLPLEVGRWVEATQPEWVALEQVPPALALWEAYAEVFKEWGYSVWCGVLRAEQYGVPQTRQRAVLIASRARKVGPPTPTHSRYYGRDPGRLDEGVEKWVSMAEALGWGYEDRPGRTLAGNRGPRWLYEDRDGTHGVMFTGANSMVTGRTGSRAGDGDVQPYSRPIDRPAPTVDTKVGSAWRFELNTGRDWKKGGTRDDAQKVPGDRPSPALDGKAARWWLQQPGTTVGLSIDQALILQSFPPDYPVQGTKTSQFRQVGNAVPPLLAAAVLGQVVSRSGQQISA